MYAMYGRPYAIHDGDPTMSIRKILLIVLLATSLSAQATEYIKETTLTWASVQATRPVQPSTQNTFFISFPSGAIWTVNGGSGGPTCSDAAAILPADNATLRAVVLAAIAAGSTVSVAVDNTLPMSGAYCQVSMLSIKGN